MKLTYTITETLNDRYRVYVYADDNRILSGVCDKKKDAEKMAQRFLNDPSYKIARDTGMSIEQRLNLNF